MNDSALDIAFEEAFIKASKINFELPPDIKLQFYAYYKQATKNSYHLNNSFDGNDLRSAFKLNAIMQISNLSQEEAKQKYIELVEKTLKDYQL